jgi:hypothetical protein
MPPTELVELEAYARYYALSAGAHVMRIGGAAALALPGVPSTMLNRVAGLGLSEPATEAHLDAIDDFFTPFGVEYAIAVAPAAQPDELTGLLAERGFVSGWGWTKFTRPADEASASITDLRVETIGAGAGAGHILIQGVSAMPGAVHPALHRALSGVFESVLGKEVLGALLPRDLGLSEPLDQVAAEGVVVREEAPPGHVAGVAAGGIPKAVVPLERVQPAGGALPVHEFKNALLDCGKGRGGRASGLGCPANSGEGGGPDRAVHI